MHVALVAMAAQIFLWSAPAIAAPFAAATATQYTRRIWRIQDGLPEDTVQAFQETPDGYLWIGTTGGLVRFDGSHFQLYSHSSTPALGDNSVFCLLAARDGSLWIGTEGGGLIRFKDGVFHAFGAADGLTDGFVRSLMEDHTGRIWIGTDNGLFQFSANKLREVDTSDSGFPFAVHAIFEDHEHHVWVGGSRLLVFDGNDQNAATEDRAQVMHLPGRDSENRVKSILETGDGTIWVGTVGGLDRLSRNRAGRRAREAFSSVSEIAGTVRTLHQTSDGTLWIGTIGHGLYRYANGRFSRFPGPNPLPSNTILSIFEDNAQQIWIGTQEGMARLSKTPVSVIPLPGDSGPDFATISADRNGTIWAVSSRVYAIRDGVAKPYRFPGMADVPVRNVFRDRAGTLWIGTDGSGVYHLTGSGVLHYAAPSTLANNFVRAFLETRNGDIWVAMDEGVSRINSRGVTNYHVRDGLAYFSTRALIEDRKGDIWIGTEHGLSHLHDGKFVHDAATAALAQEKVWSILEDHTGALWFGTRNDGLFRYVNGKMTQYTTAQGLTSNSIYQVLEDRRGYLWLSGPNTISSFPLPPPDAPDTRLKIRVEELPYGAVDAQMYGGRQPSGCIDRDGAIWFPSTKGALRVLPQPRIPSAPPKVFITRIVADGRTLPLDSPIQLILPASSSRLEIAFAPLLLRSQETVRFRYQLEGFDHDWIFAGANRAASYTNLPAGKYRFRVAAFEIGDPSVASELSFSVQKQQYFYATWWFVTLCLLAASLLIWAIYQSRVRLLQFRFKAVLEERSRLAREMHDTVIQGCTSISALLEAISSLQRENRAMEENLLDHARIQVRATIDEARQAVWNLRHKDDSVMDLAASTAEIAAHTSEEFGIAVECFQEGRAFEVDGAHARELLMVVREAVYNAALHGRPRHIRIKLVYTRDALSGSISDDGCGFEPSVAMADGHYGVAGMRERVERMGGRIEVASVPQTGTTVSFALARSHLQSSAAKDEARL